MDKDTSPIPTYGINLAKLPVKNRVSAWRKAFGNQYDMPDLPAEFHAEGRGFDFGQAVLADTIHPRFSLVRTKARARQDGVDNIFISMELSGSFDVERDDRRETIPEGRITMFDVARPVIKRASAGRTLVLAVSRDLVEDALPRIDVHAFTLGSNGDLLAEHLRNLRMQARSIPVAAAPHLIQSTMHMLAACVLPNAYRLERAAESLTSALLTRAKRYIRAHCLEPELSPEKVAVSIGTSRTTLYRAFETEGGVAEYIRHARLHLARFALYDPRDRRRIGEIGFACGFNSEAQFSRAIKAAFGATPSELRNDRGGFRPRFVKEKWLIKGWDDGAPDT